MTDALAHQVPFIVASYALTVFVIAAMIAWVVLDYYSQRRVLGEMEEQGVTRRSRRGQGSSA